VNCICGCGKRLGRDQIELNLQAGSVAMELVVWDRARSLRSPVAAAEVEATIADGARLYQEILAAIHAGEDPQKDHLEQVDVWLAGTAASRRRLSAQLPALPKKRIKLSDGEQELVDRRHPERTFTGGDLFDPEPAPVGDRYLEALLLTALEDVRTGRVEEAERALRRFLAERG
jgi:hypothetical protein